MPHTPRQFRTNAGFSLIEVMIVVAIIGILAAVGYPSYAEYVKQSRRADGHLALLNAAQTMERCKSTNFSYADCALPADLESPEGFYTLALNPEPTATTFTIVATPQGVQTSDTACTTLTLNSLGQQGPAATKDTCW